MISNVTGIGRRLPADSDRGRKYNPVLDKIEAFISRLCPHIRPASELERRFSKVFFGVFAKEADIGEVKLESDLLYAQLRLAEIIPDVANSCLSDQVHRGTSALRFADGT